MKLKTCEYCGLEFSAELTHCPLCGRAAPTAPKTAAEDDSPSAPKAAPAPQGQGKWLKKKGGKYAAKHAPAAQAKGGNVYSVPKWVMILLCSVLALLVIAGALFGGAWWVAPVAYFVGVAAVIISGIILKKTRAFAGDPAPFVMELPPYHVPSAENVLRSTWERGWSFIKRAGTVILAASVLIWFTSSFGLEGGFHMVEDMDASILAAIGGAIAPLFAPLGFGNWQSTVATIMGLVAKEEVVSVFGVLYGVAGDALGMVEEAAYAGLAPIAVHFTALSAFSFLLFNLLCAPCFAAMGAIKREMNSTRWTCFAIGYLCVFAYAIALIVYQLGLLLAGGAFTLLTAVALVLLAGLVYLLLRKNPYEHGAATSSKAQASKEATVRV